MKLRDRKTKMYRWFDIQLPRIEVPVQNEISPFASNEITGNVEKIEIDIYEPTGRIEYDIINDKVIRFEYKYVGTRWG